MQLSPIPKRPPTCNLLPFPPVYGPGLDPIKWHDGPLKVCFISPSSILHSSRLMTSDGRIQPMYSGALILCFFLLRIISVLYKYQQIWSTFS